jgi:hypothetical protein
VDLNSTHSALFPIEFAASGPAIAPFQAVVRYQSLSGLSKIRVFSTLILCSDDLSQVFLSFNESVVLKYIVSIGLKQLISEGSDRRMFIDTIANLLLPFYRGYRHFVVRSKQFVSPPSLPHLPVFCLGVIKSFGFAYGVVQTERFSYLYYLEHFSPKELIIACYPQLCNLTEYLKGKGSPQLCELTKRHLLPFRVFVLNDGVSTWIWAGKSLDSQLCEDLFQESEVCFVEDIEPNETTASLRLFGFVRGTLRLCIQDGIGHYAFLSRLIEDQTGLLPSREGFMNRLDKLSYQN